MLVHYDKPSTQTEIKEVGGDARQHRYLGGCGLGPVQSKRGPACLTRVQALEGNDTAAKVLAMKKAVMMLLNGEQLPQLFITIVRYVLPSEDHTVQKLLLLYLVRAFN